MTVETFEPVTGLAFLSDHVQVIKREPDGSLMFRVPPEHVELVIDLMEGCDLD